MKTVLNSWKCDDVASRSISSWFELMMLKLEGAQRNLLLSLFDKATQAALAPVRRHFDALLSLVPPICVVSPATALASWPSWEKPLRVALPNQTTQELIAVLWQSIENQDLIDLVTRDVNQVHLARELKEYLLTLYQQREQNEPGANIADFYAAGGLAEKDWPTLTRVARQLGCMRPGDFIVVCIFLDFLLKPKINSGIAILESKFNAKNVLDRSDSRRNRIGDDSFENCFLIRCNKAQTSWSQKPALSDEDEVSLSSSIESPDFDS